MSSALHILARGESPGGESPLAVGGRVRPGPARRTPRAPRARAFDVDEARLTFPSAGETRSSPESTNVTVALLTSDATSAVTASMSASFPALRSRASGRCTS